MSLVGYDVSSSDEEDETASKTKLLDGKVHGTEVGRVLKLSTILPEPKGGSSSLGSTSGSKRGPKASIRITAPKIPALDENDSDDETSEPAKKRKLQGGGSAGKTRSGLFAKLPAPMNAAPTGKQPSTNFLPYVFTKSKKGEPSNATPMQIKNKEPESEKPNTGESVSSVPSIAEIRRRSAQAAAKVLSSQTAKIPAENADSDDDSAVGFFSYVEKVPEDKVPNHEMKEPDTNKANANLAPDVPEPVNYNYASYDTGSTTAHMATPQRQVESGQEAVDMGEIFRLQGKRNRNEEVNFIDIHGDDALEGGKEMLLKQISEEKGMERASHQKTKASGGIMKRKHQLPYLVEQAKAREVELKNMWAQNRVTKQQTQSKYGW